MSWDARNHAQGLNQSLQDNPSLLASSLGLVQPPSISSSSMADSFRFGQLQELYQSKGQTNQLFPVRVWDYTPSWGPIPTGVPHTFIQTPNLTRGFYPQGEYHFLSAFVTVTGEVRNDLDHPRNPTPTQTFMVDVATLSRVEQGMSWSPQLYELNNGFWNHAYNCTGWANTVLAGAGLKGGWGGVGANPWTN